METALQRPHEAEQLAADYPEAEIYREVWPDGSHGLWAARLEILLRAETPEALRGKLAAVDQVRHSTTDASSSGQDPAEPS